MLVGAIMSTNPVTVERDHTVLHVARLMRERHIGAVVVVDEDGCPEGILTDRDIAVRAFQSPDPGSVPVDKIMTRNPYSAGEDTLIFDLLREMARRKIRRVPILDSDGTIIGMVSMDDVILILTTELGNVAEVLGAASRGLNVPGGEEE